MYRVRDFDAYWMLMVLSLQADLVFWFYSRSVVKTLAKFSQEFYAH